MSGSDVAGRRRNDRRAGHRAGRLLPGHLDVTRIGAINAEDRPRHLGAPGALMVERNVLEWRFDPASDARLPEATGYDVDVVVLCSEGYTSSLAADALRSLGLHRATDVIGGYVAWADAGLPTTGGTGTP